MKITLLLLLLFFSKSQAALADSLVVATAALIGSGAKSGKIQIYRGNVLQSFSSPADVQEEDLVTSAADQTILITLREGSLVTLAPASGVEVSKVAPAATVAGTVASTTLRIDSGVADFQAAKIYLGNTHFRVKSKDALTSVRPDRKKSARITEFVAEQDSREANLHTLSGAVEFSSVGRPNDLRIVGAGEATLLSSGAIDPTKVARFEKAAYLDYLKGRGEVFFQQIAKNRKAKTSSH